MNNRTNKPIKLSDSIQYINKNLINKYGKIEYIIFSKWSEIVGTFFAQYSTPERISMFPNKTKYNDENNEIILHVNVNSAAAIEFQHFQNKILEKINSFLGYKAVHRIKIQQSLNLKNTAKFKKINTSEENFSNIKKIEIKDTTQKINDKGLEKSLINLGLSITKNEQK